MDGSLKASLKMKEIKDEKQKLKRNVTPYWRWKYFGIGVLSIIWLFLRSGTQPRRIVYPCQQSALISSMGLLQYFSSLVASTTLWQVLKGRWVAAIFILCVIALTCIILLAGCDLLSTGDSGSTPMLPAWANNNAVSEVFAVHNIPTPRHSLSSGSVPVGVKPADALYDAGVDALINLMDTNRVYFYKTTSHPTGIIGPDDVVVIKINNQWNGDVARTRTHTNNDVLKGLIYRVVQHPEGFSGVVVLAENTQFTAPNWDSEDHNNAQDTKQSYQNVLDAISSQGHNVCIADWKELGGTFVDDYDTGDSRDGYVLVDDPGEPGTDQLSYPKFELACGSQIQYVSMRYGLWNGSGYDNSRLKLINLPVLKRHGWAGATISVKNYIGFLTTGDRERRFGSSEEMHGFFWGFEGHHPDYGLLARQMARIRRADINIVDAIWVAVASNKQGCPGDCIRQNALLASTDPFALDYYASVNVLSPLKPSFSLRNVLRSIVRHSSLDDSNAAHHGSKFRNFLLCNENRLRLEGVTDYIDLDDSFTQAQEEAQFNVYLADASFFRGKESVKDER